MAKDVSGLPPLAATEVRKEFHVPCHFPKSNIDYKIFLCEKINLKIIFDVVRHKTILVEIGNNFLAGVGLLDHPAALDLQGLPLVVQLPLLLLQLLPLNLQLPLQLCLLLF